MISGLRGEALALACLASAPTGVEGRGMDRLPAEVLDFNPARSRPVTGAARAPAGSAGRRRGTPRRGPRDRSLAGQPPRKHRPGSQQSGTLIAQHPSELLHSRCPCGLLSSVRSSIGFCDGPAFRASWNARRGSARSRRNANAGRERCPVRGLRMGGKALAASVRPGGRSHPRPRCRVEGVRDSRRAAIPRQARERQHSRV